MSQDNSIPYISADFINEHTEYPILIEKLRFAFAQDQIIVPDRHHHNFGNQENSTLLLMPAWQKEQDLGLKMVTVNPENTSLGIPSIQGIYILADASTGAPKAILDAKALTNKRTAATSALATSFLAKRDASALLMIGTGALAPELIKAHTSVRPIEKVLVWGRHFEHAKKIELNLKMNDIEIEAVRSIEDNINKADIVSAATFSYHPLIMGRYLTHGQHIDLVGSYKPDMREADDEVIKKSEIYVDTYRGATQESGDLVIPLRTGIINMNDIKSDLKNLCNNTNPGRTNEHQITLFKSVGYALEDLVAAKYYYQLYNSQ